MPANAGIFLDGTLSGSAARPQPQFARLQLCLGASMFSSQQVFGLEIALTVKNETSKPVSFPAHAQTLQWTLSLSN